MNVWLERAQNVLTWMQAFGPGPGLRAFLRKRRKSGLIEMRIPTARHPLYIRANTADVYMFKEVFIEHEYGIAGDIRPKVIVDAGANVGYASVYFANRYPEARIIAIEPERSNAELLRRNVGPYPQIEVIEAAVWYERGTLMLEDGGNSSAFHVREGDGGVPALTIPDIMTRAGTDRIDILKIDVEGAEKEIFTSRPPWLGNVGILMIELHDRFKPGCSKAVYAALLEHDFRELRHQSANWFVSGALAAEVTRAAADPQPGRS